ncbi:MAG TPA: ATP-binding protein [Polyangiaceae bacterium]|nr:ATP-binding protein [Polyangiaceae bacterium]
MIITVLEALGLLASLGTIALVTRAPAVSPGASSSLMKRALLGLVGLLAFGHLANVLESFGMEWADTIADQFSTLVPFVWGLFLLEGGRVYLSARLRASDEQVRFFLEAVPAAVAWIDDGQNVLGFSRAWATALPGSSSGVALKTLLPAPLPQLAKAIEECLRGGSEHEPAFAEESAEDDAGRLRYFRWSIRRWVHPDRPAPGALLSFEEVTLEHEAEAERLAAADGLARIQRLAHVGQMAAGAAHDFNNFLQVIYAATIELEGDARYEDALKNVQSALSAAGELTRGLLRFGQEPTASNATVDLVTLLREFERPLGYALGRRHRLEVKFPRVDQVRIEGRPSRIQQALLNLAINARDAMPNGGAIEVALAVESGQATLSVHDSGVGIPPSLRERLFTPFFTTKGSQGSGLGLNVVKTVVEEHRGQITVASEPNLGTTFSLYLPLFEARAAAPGLGAAAGGNG